MKKNYQIVAKVFLIALAFAIPSVLFSQNANREEGGDKLIYQWYVNGNFGITQSYCDIQGGSWHGAMLKSGDIDYGFGLRLGKHISPVFGIYGAYILAPLKGQSGVDSKNMYFETSLTDMMIGTTVSFSNLFFGYKPRLINIYGTTGIGLVNFDSQAYFKDTDPAVPVNEGYPNTTETMIPTGIGADIRLNDRWDINLETTIRWFDSDKLDGYISGQKNDAYFYTSLGIGYSFIKAGGGKKIQVETEPNMLAVYGDSIPIEIKGSVPEKFNKAAVVDFTPVLKYGDKTKQLETMYLQGEEVPAEYQKGGAVIIPAEGGSFTYRTYVKYEPGMDICELYVEPMASVKGKTPYSLSDRKIADGLIMTSRRLDKTEKVLVAQHGYVRDIVVSESGAIYYVVNKDNVNFSYKLNKDADAKEVLNNLNAFIEKGWEIKSVDIDAWASPEGEESYNQGLSQRRSESAQKYFQKKFDGEANFNLKANGEDWDGFMKAVKASDIEDKNIIANVINSQSDLAKREQEIRNMTVIYKEIEDEILPPLRRAEIRVNCVEPSLSDAEIAQFATSTPDSLTVAELLYAATLTTDANAQLSIYKTVMTNYPNDWRGYNNAGFASYELGDYSGAAGYFDKARQMAANQGVVLNNTGAMASRNGNYEQARSDYYSAQKAGVDVNYNMGIVKVGEGNYNGAVNSFGGTKCDYNLALAHLLSENYNAAKSTLDCAEKTADNYYLMAIIGARTSDDNMVFENLKNAIAKDASYKETAKEDREFMKYFSNPSFQSAIQ
jgi:tetratricopeptide (TPR) repeat protein